MPCSKEEYDAYLRGDHWQQVRKQKLERKGGTKKRCAICGAKSRLQVHHLFYRQNWYDVEQADLRILCDPCHEMAHRLLSSGRLKVPWGDDNVAFSKTRLAVKRALGYLNPHYLGFDKGQGMQASMFEPEVGA